MFPFGEKCQNNGLVSVENPYLYGGKELQTFFGIDWYDSGARFQKTDGTFSSLDPKAESYYPISPYAYCAGDPVNYVDPEGLWHWNSNGDLIWDKHDNINTLSHYLNISFEKALQIISRNSPDIAVFGKGYTITKNNIWFEEREPRAITVNNTPEALKHYFNGAGEVADVGDEAVELLVSSTVFKNKLKKITSQTVVPQGNFSVNLTRKVFHIGKTNVNYSVTKGVNCDIVSFELFINDGFWDPNFFKEKKNSNNVSRIPDGLGPNLELGGRPYRYAVRTRTYYFKPILP